VAAWVAEADGDAVAVFVTVVLGDGVPPPQADRTTAAAQANASAMQARRGALTAGHLDTGSSPVLSAGTGSAR